MAIAAGLDEHAGRAMLNAAWMLKDAGGTHARGVLERGLAFARERDIDIYAEYLVATGALIDLATGEWDAANAAAAGLVAQPRLANAVARIPALEVVGLVGLRRGQPGAREHLDEAWQLAQAAGELQRLRPVACARAEAAWLNGDAEAVDAATSDMLALALEVGHEWDVGELVLWRFRAGLPAVASESCPLPIACELAGEAGGAARQWTAWASRTPRRSPCWAPRPRAGARLDRAAGPARRDRRGRPRARPAAPRGRDRRPARAASGDTREPGRADRPPARAYSSSWRRDSRTPRSRGGCSSRPRPSSITSPRRWPSSACTPGGDVAGAARGLGIRRAAKLRGPARSTGGFPVARLRRAAVASTRVERLGRLPMMTVDVADTELKARHRAMWASGDYPAMVETFLLPLGPRLVDALPASAPGMRVLDVAAGTGNAVAARRAAPARA